MDIPEITRSHAGILFVRTGVFQAVLHTFLYIPQNIRIFAEVSPSRLRTDHLLTSADGKYREAFYSLLSEAGSPALPLAQALSLIHIYPAILQEKLGSRYRVRNYGLRGRTLLDYGNFPYKEEPEYKETLKEKADIYIIMLGTNDSKVRNWNTEDYKEQFPFFHQENTLAAA